MVDHTPVRPYSFLALRKTFGPLFVRCDACRRHVRLRMASLRDVDYRTKTFSCSACGAPGYLAIEDPTTEKGMGDYRLDPVARPERHPDAVVRLTAPARRPEDGGGELPGRKIDGRR